MIEESLNGQQKADRKKGIENKEKNVYSGFVAQEVEAAAKKIGFNFSGVYKPQNDHDTYGLSYSDFVVPLVKAVQELSNMNNIKDAKIDTLQSQNDQQQKQIDAQQAQLNDLKNMVLSIQQKQEQCNPCNAVNRVNQSQSYTTLSDAAYLEQNIPNPFTNTTSIGYTLPQKFTTAQIMITDKSGKTLKAINISGSKGSVTIDASTLASGAYQYSLIVDGKLIDTKQMVIAK